MIILVIIMKGSFIVPIIISILLGGLCGKFVFSQYQMKEEVFNENNTVYFLQQGVYSTESSLDQNTEQLNSKVTVLEDGKYYVYIGITKDLENAQKVKEMFEEKGYQIYQKELPVSNYEFINNLEQYDILLKSAKKEEEIQSVMDVILASYEETVLSN